MDFEKFLSDVIDIALETGEKKRAHQLVLQQMKESGAMERLEKEGFNATRVANIRSASDENIARIRAETGRLGIGKSYSLGMSDIAERRRAALASNATRRYEIGSRADTESLKRVTEQRGQDIIAQTAREQLGLEGTKARAGFISDVMGHSSLLQRQERPIYNLNTIRRQTNELFGTPNKNRRKLFDRPDSWMMQ